jgi:hypothetical protein
MKSERFNGWNKFSELEGEKLTDLFNCRFYVIDLSGI